MAEILNSKKNYVRNFKTSRDRTIRIELMGELGEVEKKFLDGVAFFAVGTLSKNKTSHIQNTRRRLWGCSRRL